MISKFSTSGEVLYRSPGVFQRYYKNEEATAEVKTPDGWVRSGDAGFFDSRGHLVIIDRAKDVGRLKDGSLFAPKYLENKLKFFPEIKEAVAFGHGRDFVTVFVNIDLVSVGSWAERNNVVYASYQELAAHPEVYAMIERRVDEVNAMLAQEPKMASSQIRRFLVLPKELDADDGELTRTQKVRRGFIAERYAPLIRALYDGSKECHIRMEVTFEDGRKGMIEGNVRIVDMKLHEPSFRLSREAAVTAVASSSRATLGPVATNGARGSARRRKLSLRFGGVTAIAMCLSHSQGEIRAIIERTAPADVVLNVINGFYQSGRG